MQINLLPQSNINPDFKSRNAEIRKADAICRNVRKELPVYSNTFMERFSTKDKISSNKNMLSYIGDMIYVLRDYYTESNNSNIFKILAGMKKAKVGNCFEQAYATDVALKANGYKNVRTFALYSVNPKTGKVRDLDHVVSTVNFKIPKHYKFVDLSKVDEPSANDLIKPNNKAIVIDSWAGFSDYAKSAVQKYKSDVPLGTKIEPDEKLRFLPFESIYLDKEDIKFARQKYSGLLLSQNKNKMEDTKILNNPLYQISDIPDETILKVKNDNNLGMQRCTKNAEPEILESQNSVSQNEPVKKKSKTAFYLYIKKSITNFFGGYLNRK